jgi:hypothetical protein
MYPVQISAVVSTILFYSLPVHSEQKYVKDNIYEGRTESHEQYFL